MKKQVSGSISISFRFLVMIILLGYGYPSSYSAAIVQSSDGKPCVDGTIFIEEQVDAPARLAVEKATCGDFYSNVDLRL